MSALVGVLEAYAFDLADSISVEALAKSILAALSQCPGADIDWTTIENLESNLRSIVAGKSDAHNYHATVFTALPLLFRDSLSVAKKEEPMFGGVKRIDITFSNHASEGFFAELHDSLKAPCPLIPIECKNYSGDIGNEELDQLSGRLNENVGRLGILVCRSIEDEARSLQRRVGYIRKMEFLITLDDKDLTSMSKAYLSGKREEMEAILFTKLRQLLLN